MKKIALIALLAAITTTTTFGQDTSTVSDPIVPPNTTNSSPALRMGLSVSPMLSWFSMDIDETYVQTEGVRFNIQYGLHIDKRLGSNPNYYLSTGVFVMNTGGSLEYGYVDEDGIKSIRTSDFRFNYVNIPIALMLRTNDVGYMTYFARVGFDNGFNIKASQDYTEQTEATSPETVTFNKEDADDFINLYRVALHLELGVEYKLTGNTRLMISAEWNNGLNNVFNKDFKAASINGGWNDLEQKSVKGSSNAFMLRAGVYF